MYRRQHMFLKNFYTAEERSKIIVNAVLCYAETLHADLDTSFYVNRRIDQLLETEDLAVVSAVFDYLEEVGF